MVGEGKVVRHGNRRAQPVGLAVHRHEEPRLALHRGIGALEVGDPDDGHAEKVKKSIAIGDRRLVLAMNDGLCPDAPGRRFVRVLLARLARGEPAVVKHGDVAGFTRGGLRDDARIVLGHHTQRIDEAVAEVVGQRHLVRGDDRAFGILDAHVALRRERVGVAVVDHLIGEQRVVAVVDLDVAFGRHPVVLVVVDHLVGLQQHGLALVHAWRLENGAEITLLLLTRGDGGCRHAKGERAGKQADKQRHVSTLQGGDP